MTQSIDHLIREALAAGRDVVPPTPCLDADTAAAFVDDALPAHERSAVEAHAGGCARCQALLAALARMAPAASAPAWWRRPAIAWLAPFAVAATAAIVWINVPRGSITEPAAQSKTGTRAAAAEPRPTLHAPAATTPAESSRDAAARRVAPDAKPNPAARMVPESNRFAARVARESNRDYAAPRGAQPAPGAAGIRRQTGGEGAGAGPGHVGGAADAQQLPSMRVAQADALQTPAPPAPPAAPHAAASVPPAQTNTATQRVEANERVAVVSLAAETMTQGARARALDAAAETAIVSADSIARWRIGRDGAVHYSADGGATWQTRSARVNASLAAGSSPSRSVCWLVGPAGLVLISTDEGRSWQRLTAPAAIDLVSVRATDDRTATVVASDGRAFTTSDRGRTWQR